jgi:transcriptional regulator with XRE-family HTH domain
MNNNYIGENIKLYRERQNLTQQQLADKIGKTWEMISRYERGVSSPLNQLESLAKALNTTPSDLLNDITEKNIKLNFNKVPLFTNISRSFAKEDTYLYYNTPDWILSLDPNTFAIDMRVVDDTNGVVFISPNSEININDMVLIREDNHLKIITLKSFNDTDIIGKVLAQEVRY